MPDTFIYLGPWVWDTSDAALPHWRGPVGTLGSIDLRTLPQMAQVGGSPQGVGLFVTNRTLGSDYTLLGATPDDRLDATQLAAWESLVGVRPATNSIASVLWETLTTESDPAGEAAPGTLQANHYGRLQLHLQPFGLIEAKRFSTSMPEWPKLQLRLQRQYRLQRESCLLAESDDYLRALDARCQLYGVPYRDLQPPDLPDEAPLLHRTTIGDTFTDTNGTDLSAHTATGPNGGFGWTEILGDVDIQSNQAIHTDSAFCRADTNLSSVNHYSQIDVISFDAGAVNAEALTRFTSAAAETFCRAIARNDTTDTYRIFKRIAGSNTLLGAATNATAPVPTFALKLESDGDDHELFIDGVSKNGPHTDSTGDLDGYVRCGFGMTGGFTSGTTIDNFEAADLAAAESSSSSSSSSSPSSSSSESTAFQSTSSTSSSSSSTSTAFQSTSSSSSPTSSSSSSTSSSTEFQSSSSSSSPTSESSTTSSSSSESTAYQSTSSSSFSSSSSTSSSTAYQSTSSSSSPSSSSSSTSSSTAYQSTSSSSSTAFLSSSSSSSGDAPWWFPRSYTITTGTLNGGTIGDVYTVNATYLSFNEVSGTPGFIVQFDWYGIPSDVTNLEMDMTGRYEGNPAHNVILEAWDWVAEGWEAVTGADNDFASSATDVNYHFTLSDAGWLSADGEVRLRFNHTSAGNPTHDLFIDFLRLSEIIGSSSSHSSSSSSSSTSSSTAFQSTSSSSPSSASSLSSSSSASGTSSSSSSTSSGSLSSSTSSTSSSTAYQSTSTSSSTEQLSTSSSSEVESLRSLISFDGTFDTTLAFDGTYSGTIQFQGTFDTSLALDGSWRRD